MTTWTLTQIKQARGLRSRAEVDVEAAQRGALPAAEHKMALAMIHMAHPFAIEVNEEDFRFRTAESERPFTVEVTAWWEPRTREVELRGGERDGEVIEFRGAPRDPLRVTQRMGGPATMDDSDYPERLAHRIDTYELAGWSETERRWVYEAK